METMEMTRSRPNPSFPKGRLHPPHPLQGGVDTLTRVRGSGEGGLTIKTRNSLGGYGSNAI